MPNATSIENRLPGWAYKLLMVLATVLWGYSFVSMKVVVQVVPTAWLLGIRFLSAGILLLLILNRRVIRALSKDVLIAAGILALLDLTAYWTQTVGLVYTTPGINAFLTATYVVIFPFLWWIFSRSRPSIFNIGAAVIAVVGIWFVSVSGSGETLSFGLGEGLTLICALMFALHLVAVSKFVRKYDILVLTGLQFFIEGAIACLMGAGLDGAPPLSSFNFEIVAQMVFLVVFASVLCFGIQNVSLGHVPPTQASLILSLESVFGVVFSVLVYGEQLTGRLLLGFVLIFIAIVISETLPIKRKDLRAEKSESAEAPELKETSESAEPKNH